MKAELSDFDKNYINDIYAGHRMHGLNKPDNFIDNSAITLNESKFLQSLILANGRISKTIEIGCAYGLSSLSICSATRNRIDPHHIIIDPKQSTDWDGVGILNLAKINVNFYTLIEKGSEFALPMLAENSGNSIDLALIDGWHTFDQTLIDAFYLIRMLRIGGFLIIDDYDWPAVRKVADYLETLPCLIRVDGAKRGIRKNDKILHKFIFFFGRYNLFLRGKKVNAFLRKRLRGPLLFVFLPQEYETMVCFQKISDDNRNYDFHKKF
jgi:predicted O-methyltransferase YrrM